MAGMLNFQIGKNGITDGVIEALALAFKNRKMGRISLLSASGRDREKIKEMAQELCDRLGEATRYKYSSSIIGFKVILRRRLDSSRPKKPKRKPL